MKYLFFSLAMIAFVEIRAQIWSMIDFEYFDLQPTEILKLPDGNVGVMSDKRKFDTRIGEPNYVTDVFYVVTPEGQIEYENILNTPESIYTDFTVFDEENIFVPYTKWLPPLVTYCSEDSISIGETHRRGVNRQFFFLDRVVNVFDSTFNENGYCEHPDYLAGAIHENDLLFITQEAWGNWGSDKTYRFQRHDLNGNELSNFELIDTANKIPRTQQGIFLDGKMLFLTNLSTIDSTLIPLDYPRYPGIVEYDLNSDRVSIINTGWLGNNFSQICDIAQYDFDPTSFIVPYHRYDPSGDEYSIGRMDKEYNLLWRKIIPAPVKIIGLSNGNIAVISPARQTFTVFLFDENGVLLAEKKYDNPLNAFEYKPVSFALLNDEKTFVVVGLQGRDTTIARGFGNVDYRVGLMTHSLDSLDKVSSTFFPTFQESIKVFPNPANESISIKIPQTEMSFSMQIFSSLGQRVLSKKAFLPNKKINVSRLSNGLYYYEIITEKGLRKSGKIVIAK